MISATSKIFLIYIPCHSDYERARETSLKIRSQFAEIQDSKIKDFFTLKIIISANGVKIPTEKCCELKATADIFNYVSEPLGGDTNINQGYLKALEINPDYFWILSANEFLVEGAINYILNTILDNDDSDLYVTNSRNRYETYLTSNVFIDVPPGSGYGLISSVIYNFKRTQQSFSAGPRFAWTGWGQLAVLQTACSVLGKLRVTEYPDTKIYLAPFTDVDSGSEESEYEFVRRTYAHSFFGMPILIFALFDRDKAIRNRVMFAWLKKNWFKLRYFQKGAQREPDSNFPQFDVQWVQQIANLIFSISGPAISFLGLVGKVLNIEKMRENKLLICIKRKYFQS